MKKTEAQLYEARDSRRASSIFTHCDGGEGYDENCTCDGEEAHVRRYIWDFEADEFWEADYYTMTLFEARSFLPRALIDGLAAEYDKASA